MPGPARRGYPDEERLPWLDEAPQRPARPTGRPVLPWIVAALVLLAVIAMAARLWPAGDAEADGGLIRAPEGPYKVRPADPGGMSVEGAGSAAHAASEGGDPRGALDLSAVPEAPVVRDRAAATEAAPAPVSASAPGAAVQGGNGAIQLGAFSTEAKANAAWKALSQRFAFLAPLESVVLPARSGDATIYRLRAAAGVNAQAMCGRLRVAGETCLVVP